MTPARILVVDDESPLRNLVRPYFEAEGYEVIEASSGPVALDLVREGGIDLAIVDVMLPGLDGIEVVKRIRESSGIPVILLTARREEGERVAGVGVSGGTVEQDVAILEAGLQDA